MKNDKSPGSDGYTTEGFFVWVFCLFVVVVVVLFVF